MSYTSKHTGAEIDAGIDKANAALSQYCIFEIYESSECGEYPSDVQIIPYHSEFYMMQNWLRPFVFGEWVYALDSSLGDLPSYTRWDAGQPEGKSGGVCHSCTMPADGTHTPGAKYKIYIFE